MNILITGGASGFGEAITRNLAAVADNKVYFTYCRSAEKAKALEKEFANVKGVYCDFSNENSIDAILHEIEKWNIEVLINNALTGLQTIHFHKMPAESFLEDFRKNILPVIKITQAAILHFRKQKHGKIITILSSYVDGNPPIGLSAYVASKNYLLSLSKSWAIENSKFNITTNCISPSFLQTGLTADTDERVIEEMINKHPDKKLLTLEEVAGSVKYFVNAGPEVNQVHLVINSRKDFL